MVQGQEANGDNLGKAFNSARSKGKFGIIYGCRLDLLYNNGMLHVLIRITSVRQSNLYTQHTISR